MLLRKRENSVKFRKETDANPAGYIALRRHLFAGAMQILLYSHNSANFSNFNMATDLLQELWHSGFGVEFNVDVDTAGLGS